MKSNVYIKKYNAPKIDKKEVLRYAGVRDDDESVLSLLDRCIKETEQSFSYNACYTRYPVSIDGDSMDLGFARVNSHSLALCLCDCDEIVVFCATVGVEIDRLIRRYSLTSPSIATMLQALGSERVEALCDVFCADIEKEIGRKLRPRFSPGYGDLPLELQREIFACLEPCKIGVSLSENLFMTPSKSVTAIIGIKREI